MTRLTSLFADWVEINEADGAGSDQTRADALLRACEGLSDEVLSSLPATPDDAAAALASRPFADRAEGAYLPIEWLEPYCAGLRLPLADIDGGWDISDGEDVYFCPRVDLADDSDAPDDKRPFVRVDAIRRWPQPR